MKIRGLWALEIDPSSPKRITFNTSVRISMASLKTFIGDERTFVSIMFDKKSVVLCSLRPDKIEQQVIDITCLEGETVTFTSKGANIVNLVGNYVSLAESDNEEEAGNIDMHENRSSSPEDINEEGEFQMDPVNNFLDSFALPEIDYLDDTLSGSEKSYLSALDAKHISGVDKRKRTINGSIDSTHQEHASDDDEFQDCLLDDDSVPESEPDMQNQDDPKTILIPSEEDSSDEGEGTVTSPDVETDTESIKSASDTVEKHTLAKSKPKSTKDESDFPTSSSKTPKKKSHPPRKLRERREPTNSYVFDHFPLDEPPIPKKRRTKKTNVPEIDMLASQKDDESNNKGGDIDLIALEYSVKEAIYDETLRRHINSVAALTSDLKEALYEYKNDQLSQRK